MQAEANPFNRAVATRLARVANRYPERLPYLVDFCRRYVEVYAEQLIQVAQAGEGALGQALALLWQEHSFHHINERIFRLLPERTVQLRNFTVELVKQMISSGADYQYSLGQRELRAILAGRLRDAGRFGEALTEARKLVADPGLADESPELQAVVWSNLGVCYAEIGNATASYEAHRRAICFYQIIPAERLQQIANQLAGESVNLAAAAMKVGLWEEAEAWSQQGLKLAGKLTNAGLLLRAQLVRVTFLSETNQLEAALEAGELILEQARDLEEVDQQSYSSLLLDVYINLGSILLDLNRGDEAGAYFESANLIAADIDKQAPSISSKSKLVVSMIALAHTQIAQGDRQGLDNARTALSLSRSLSKEAGNDYQQEIMLRAIEVNVAADIEFADSTPDIQLVEQLINFADVHSAALAHDGLNSSQRRLHLGSMAFSKIGLKHRGLWCAQEAVRLADLAGANVPLYQGAQRAVLYDGLSRRLEEMNQLSEAIEKAEAACRILLPFFSVHQDTYQDWLFKFMEHFRELAIKLDKFEYFKAFFTTEVEPRLSE